MAGKVFIVSAPSGAGKSTLVKAMLAQFEDFVFSISATTRSPRAYETEGVHYYFLSLSDFLQKRKAGAFVESEEVYPGRWYGTLASEVDRILVEGKMPIFDVDVEGGLNIKQQYREQAVAFFIQPPRPEILLERLQNRGSDDMVEIQKRYAKAKLELSYAPKFDHIIVNDDLQIAIDEMAEIIRRELSNQ
ncbi:MAG: guanylate kinase [Bacteroidota bacterium]